jgi:integrase
VSDAPRDLSVVRKPLTNTAIDALKPGHELKDDRVPGLSVRANGSSKSFLLYYRFKGQPRRPKIGAWGVLSIADARTLARGMLARVAAGEDPSADRQRERLDPILNDLWDRCEIEHWCRGKSWDAEAKRIYEKDIKPVLGTKRVKAISIEDAKDVRDRLADRPIQANRAIAVLSKMLNLAETFGPEGRRWRDLMSNPCQRVPRFKERHRKRFAKPAEIKDIGAILEGYAESNPNAVAFIYLLMYSGARPTELLRATPDQVERIERDGKVYGVLRIPEGKTGHRDVFLPPQALAALDRLPAKRERLVGLATTPKRVWRKIREEAGIDDLWLRDWRRTWATVGLSGGVVSKGQLGELMGHADPKTTSIYAKLIEDTSHDAAAAVADRMELFLGRSAPAAEPAGDLGQEVEAQDDRERRADYVDHDVVGI